MKKIQIAIDGPASAGKSTVAKIIARKLGYVYCDTGAMYRATTYAAQQAGIALDDDAALKAMLPTMKLEFVPDEPEQRVIVNNVSVVAAQPSVRADLTKRQQDIAAAGGIVMDGRDIGTTVLPNAPVKIFLEASVHERALRRFKENQEKGIDTPLEVLEQEIAARDKKDSTRKISPLTKAPDAITVDTTSMGIEQVVTRILEIVQEATA